MYMEMLEHVREILCPKVTPQSACTPRPRFPFRDRYLHTVRVCGWVERLLECETCVNAHYVRIAAIFHDSGYVRMPTADHPLLSAEICRAYLTEHRFDPAEISRIVYLVAMHSEKDRPDSELTPELRVLFDADLLDEVGALTVLWDCLDEGLRSDVTYQSARDRIEGAYRRLLPKRARMRTRQGLLLYDMRMEWMRGFLDQLDDELAPADISRIWDEPEAVDGSA